MVELSGGSGFRTRIEGVSAVCVAVGMGEEEVCCGTMGVDELIMGNIENPNIQRRS